MTMSTTQGPGTPPLRVSEEDIYRPGDRVTVVRVTLRRRPFIEGKATVVFALDAALGVYLVQFEGEPHPRPAQLFPRALQDDVQAVLDSLELRWLTTVQPELLQD